MSKKYITVKTQSQYDEMLQHIVDSEYIAFDTETTGLNVRKDQIIGFSVSGEIGVGYYFPILRWNELEKRIEYHTSQLHFGYANLFKAILNKNLIMHNASFDIRIVKNDLGIDLLKNLVADTMLMKHTVNEEGRFGLKATAIEIQQHIGLNVEEEANKEQIELLEHLKSKGASTTRNNYELYKGDTDIIGKYGASDTDLTLRIFEYYYSQIEREQLLEFFFDKEVMPLYTGVTIPMESKGVKLDLPLIEKTRKEIIADMAKLEKKIQAELEPISIRFVNKLLDDKAPVSNKGGFAQEIAKQFKLDFPLTKSGKFSITKKTLEDISPIDLEQQKAVAFLKGTDNVFHKAELRNIQAAVYKKKTKLDYIINISSKDHLSAIFFDILGEKPLSRTDKGKAQMDDKMLEELAKDYNAAHLISEYNKLVKNKSAYIDRFLNNHENGYYYFTYKQHGTVSGRYGSDAQQLPRVKEEGELSPLVLKYNNTIRRFFIAEEGRVFIDADYESLEPHCVDENSTVMLYNRGYTNIKDVKIGDRIYTSSGFKKIENKWNSEKNTLEIVTKKGVLKCSPDHKIYVKERGWVIASSINKGDTLQEEKAEYNGYLIPELPLYSKNANSSFAKTIVDRDIAWLLGAFVGDGLFCTTSSKYIGICGLEEDGVVGKFYNIIKNMGASPKKYSDYRTSGMVSYRCHDSWLVDIFKKTYKLADSDGKLLEIPKYILNSNTDIKLSFLAGLIDTDGTFNKTKEELSISTKSTKLASDLCTLGNSIGLDARIGLSHKGAHKVYQVRFTATSLNILADTDINSCIVCERKTIEKRIVEKKQIPEANVLEINKYKKSKMVDITVESNQEFVCENIRVHNCFSHVSGDEGLRDIFRKGHDFYSSIAIPTEGLTHLSADKKAPNYLGKVDKPARQSAKAYCFTKDVLVNTVDGQVPISHIKEGDMVQTLAGKKEVEKTFSRDADVLLVHTNRGTIECTKDHPFYVKGDWVDAEYLQKDDPLSYAEYFNLMGNTQYLDIMSNFNYKNEGTRPLGKLELCNDWAYFVGAIIGGGIISISQSDVKSGHGLKGYVGICGLKEEKVVDKVESFINSIWYKMRIHEDRGNFVSKVVTNSELCKIVYDTLKIGNMSDTYKCKNLKIPDYIFKASLSQKLSFIAGLFDTDGYLKSKGSYSDIAFCSKDHRLSTGLIVLLKSLGVDCSYRLEFNKTYKKNYYIVSVSRHGAKRLSFLGLGKYLACDRKRKAIQNAKLYIPHYKKPRTESTRVLKIEYINEKKTVFDIRVKDEHNFYANGILVHNCLGVPYGMTAYALSKAIDIEVDEAEEKIFNYTRMSFPKLGKWMDWSKDFVHKHGYMKTETGRIRHLPKVKKLFKFHGEKLMDFRYRKKLQMTYSKEEVLSMYRDYKNGVNNARNVQIQGLSASIINLAMVEINKEFNKRNIDAWVCCMVHDQAIINAPKGKEKECANIVQDKMENTYKLSVDLKAPPETGANWHDTH